MRIYLSLGILFSLFLITSSLFYRRFKGEKRSLWLALELLLALFFFAVLMALILVIIEEVYVPGLGYTLLLFGAVALALVVGFFPLVFTLSLFTSGVQVIRKEGGGLGHYLSLGLGIAYVVYLIAWPLAGQLEKSLLFDFIYAYLSFVFVSLVFVFILYTVASIINLWENKKKSYDTILVLGSGLREGREVPPLLASRIDKGIEAHWENPGSLMVFSGGQGTDEKLAEAQAMAGYALARGVDQESIIIEDKSTSTRENLVFTKAYLEAKGLDLGQLLVVSSNYHVFRALLLARKEGIDCDGRGAKTRFYYSLNAFIREWIAFVVMEKRGFLMFFGMSLSVFTLVFGLGSYLGL